MVDPFSVYTQLQRPLRASRPPAARPGNHSHCTKDCQGVKGDDVELEEGPRPEKAEQPDIFDIEELRGQQEGDAAVTGDDGSAEATEMVADVGVGAAKAATGSGKKGGKKKLRHCVGSKYTVGSMRQTLKDTVGLAEVKVSLWRRCRKAIDDLVEARGESGALPAEHEASVGGLREAVESAIAAAKSVQETGDTLRGQLETAFEGTFGVSVRQ